MKKNLQTLRRKLLLICMACAPWWGLAQVQAQTLEALIQETLSSHPSTQSQRSQVASATAGVDSARWQFYPTPSVSFEKANARTSDPLYQGDAQVTILGLRQPLYTGGRLSAGADKAQAILDQSQASLDETRLQLGLRVVQAYGEWLAAHGKTLAIQQSEKTHARLRDQVQRRIDEGMSADSDLMLALTRLEAVRSDLLAARAQGEIALARLGQLLGRPVEQAALVNTLALPRTVQAQVTELLDQALQVSATVKKARSQIRVQEATISELRADLSPEVYLRAERQFGNFNFSDGAPESRLFVGVNSRFGAGLSASSNVAAARSQLEAAVAEVQGQTRLINEQVLADHALALSSEQRLTSVRASLRSAQSVYESYDRQFLAGRRTWLDVMNAAREVAQTETLIADLISTQVVASWRLSFYTRGIETVTSGSP